MPPRLTGGYFQRSFSQSSSNFAGHNKWSKIKQKKSVLDNHRGTIHGKISRDIMLAVRSGGSADPALNFQLAAVLKRAKEQDIPKFNIEKALSKAMSGSGRAGEFATYEALAYNSVGLVIECLTDNANRTIHSIREVLTTHKARFAPVKFMFIRRGFIKVSLAERHSEKVLNAALEGGAEDFEEISTNSGVTVIRFTCQPNGLTKLTEVFMALSCECEILESLLVYAPAERSRASTGVEKELSHLVEELEANEDTLRVWTSLDA